MKLFATWPFFFLSLIPLVILMYFLKQKAEEKEISSVYLWEKVYRSKEVNTPWERFKNNLLLFLQLLALLLLIFSLTDPFLTLRGKDYQNVIIVIDNSGSMNAVRGNTTRLEEGKKRAEKTINSLRTGSRITIISCSRMPKVEVSSALDKAEAINSLKNIQPTSVSGELKESISLVKSISKQLESYRVFFYTDSPMDIKELNGELVNLGTPAVNVSLDYISHNVEKDGLKVMVTLTNRHTEALNREIYLYGDNKLLTLKKTELKAGETKTLYFTGIAFSGNTLKAELNEKDDLAEDNSIYDVIKQGKVQKVLLVTEKNLFLEKALATVNNIELYKSNSAGSIRLSDKYNLYIFDGQVPDMMPADGNILLVNPPDSDLVQVNGTAAGGIGQALPHDITRYIEGVNYNVEKVRDMVVPDWAQIFFKVNDKPAAFAGEMRKQRIAVIGFDLHKSDLPLNAEFPILVHNLTSYLVDTGLLTKTYFNCGDSIPINAKPDGGDLTVETPFSTSETIALRYPLKDFQSTLKPGIYKVIQKSGDEMRSNIFAANFPSDSESNISEGSSGSSSKLSQDSGKLSGMNLQVYMIIALLVIITGEWLAYIKGY